MNQRVQVETYLMQLQDTIANLPSKLIDRVIDVLLEAVHAEKKVFICGNGGSASTASHFACDLAKNTILSVRAITRKAGAPGTMVFLAKSQAK